MASDDVPTMLRADAQALLAIGKVIEGLPRKDRGRVIASALHLFGYSEAANAVLRADGSPSSGGRGRAR